nr:condensation domain-containing protein [Paenibacillus sp. JCM 10914]
MSHYQSSKKEIVLPTTTTEKRLCSIWRDVFVSDEIGVEHDLFELGGNSLKAVRIISMIQQQFGVDVQLSDLLLRTTIREMAEFLEKSNNSIIPKPFLQSIQDYSRTSYTQKRMYILNQMAPESMVYIISVAWEIDSSITWEQIVSTFEQLVQRHESMRTTFEIVGQELVQKVHETISYQSVLFHSGSNEETELFIRDFSKPFELNKDGLFRYALIKESGQRNIILFDIHHIIADGISVQRIIEEFHQVIDGGLIPPLEARYKDFIDWQYEKGFIGRLNAQEAYWLKEYSADIPLLDLPTDLVRPPIQNFEGDRVSQRINSELCKELNECAEFTGLRPI